MASNDWKILEDCRCLELSAARREQWEISIFVSWQRQASATSIYCPASILAPCLNALKSKRNLNCPVPRRLWTFADKV